MSVIWYKVWSDVWDNKARTLLAVLSIAAGVFAIGATFGMADQLLTGMDAAHQASIPSHFTMYTTENLAETLADDLKKIKGVEDIALGSQTAIRYKIRPDDEWDEGWLIMFRPPLLVAGLWSAMRDGQAIVISKDAAGDNGINLGDIVTLDLGELGDARWQVIGFYSDIFNGVGETDPIYANLDAVCVATKKYHRGDQIYVRTEQHEAAYVQAVASQLKQTFEVKSIDVAQSLTEPENRRNVDSQFDIIIVMFLIMAMIIAIVGGIGLMGSLSISVVERTREIGVMRAIRAKTPTLMGMFVMEGVLQGLLSWLVVVPLSFILGRPMANALELVLFDTTLDYQYHLSAIWLWLGIILMIAVLASILPARRATRISVRESLAYA